MANVPLRAPRRNKIGHRRIGKFHFLDNPVLHIIGRQKAQHFRDHLAAHRFRFDASREELGLAIVFKTREANAFIQNGASPRATLALNLAARGNALLKGRAYATPQDVKEVVHDVLRHRILLTYEAEAEGVTSDRIIDRILDEVPVP